MTKRIPVSYTHLDVYKRQLHMFFDERTTRKNCEAFLKEHFEIVQSEIIPTRKIPAITNEPIIWRYFVAPLKSVLISAQLDEKEFVARTVMKINTEMKGAYVFSSGKNMGTFKAVGFPEDVGVFYRLEEYEAYSWTAHGRYPTNTPGSVSYTHLDVYKRQSHLRFIRLTVKQGCGRGLVDDTSRGI